MTALFSSFRLPSLLVLATFLLHFSPLAAQDNQENMVQTEDISASNPLKTRKNTAEAEKNAHDLRKITLLLAIAQERDRQAAEATEDIRSRRLRIEEDLMDADDNPKNLTKKERSDLEMQFKSLQKKEKLALKARESANDFLLEVTQAVAAEPSKRAKFISTYERKRGPINDSKPIETLPADAYTATETSKPQTVSTVSEAQIVAENTPSVSPSISTENTSDIAVATPKKKKERAPKNNESPKKSAKKTPKNAVKPTETVHGTDDFPLVLTETATNSTVESDASNKKEVKKVGKKDTKKKSKKAAKQAETTTISEDSPVVLTENTPAPTESLVENTPTTPSENTASDASIVGNSTEKPSKKSVKTDKKTKKRSNETSKTALVSYQNYDRAADVFMNTPTPECAIAFDGKDEFTGKMKRETYPTRFFTHTDDVMRKALLDKDFITCDITGTKVESSRYTYLNLTFTILSKDIQRSLGFLDRGTPIIFVLVNGSKITLRTNKTDIGVVDIDKGTTTYKAQLTADSITDITDSELDYVRVIWSSGYEDYEIFDVDVMKNLFNCLYKK